MSTGVNLLITAPGFETKTDSRHVGEPYAGTITLASRRKAIRSQ